MSNKGINVHIPSCKKCPCEGLCTAWKSLTPKERVTIVISPNIPDTFILVKCPFNDDEFKIEGDL